MPGINLAIVGIGFIVLLYLNFVEMIVLASCVCSICRRSLKAPWGRVVSIVWWNSGVSSVSDSGSKLDLGNDPGVVEDVMLELSMGEGVQTLILILHEERVA